MTPRLLYPLIVAAVLAVLGLIAWGIVAAVRADRRRKQDLAGFARRAGLDYAERADSPAALGLPALELFDQGSARKTRCALTGSFEGHELRICDYAYTVSTGQSAATHHQTLVAVALPEPAVPGFTVCRENLFHRIGQAFGFQDIDLPHAPEFSKHYLLRGEEPDAIARTWTRPVIDAYAEPLGCRVERTAGWLIAYDPGKRLKAADVPKRIEALYALAFALEAAAHPDA